MVDYNDEIPYLTRTVCERKENMMSIVMDSDTSLNPDQSVIQHPDRKAKALGENPNLSQGALQGTGRDVKSRLNTKST